METVPPHQPPHRDHGSAYSKPTEMASVSPAHQGHVLSGGWSGGGGRMRPLGTQSRPPRARCAGRAILLHAAVLLGGRIRPRVCFKEQNPRPASETSSLPIVFTWQPGPLVNKRQKLFRSTRVWVFRGGFLGQRSWLSNNTRLVRPRAAEQA